jgi:hypothetical protein
MKLATLCVFLGVGVTLTSRADLTIVQKVEGGGPVADVTIKIKGDKTRIDGMPQMSTIIDGKTGEIINLMNSQKTAVRLSADKMKAASVMIDKFTDPDKKKPAEPPKLTKTGKKEMVNGYEAEEYVYEAPDLKAVYWIAPKYPDGAEILKQMQSLKSETWTAPNARLPDYRDFPGLPIKTVISVGDKKITSTVTSVTKAPVNESEFSIPKDFREIKTPEIGNLLEENAKNSPAESPSRKP